MKTTLTRRGYAIDKASVADTPVLSDLRVMLTVSPKLSPGNPLFAAAAAAVAAGGLPAGTFAVYRESARRFYMPRALGLTLYGLPTDGDETDGLDRAMRRGETAPAFVAPLRAEQEVPVAAFLAAARDPLRRGGILSLPCGGGKTVCALKVAAELGLKTLVVAHKEFLLDQWKERIATFMPAARVGVIKAKRIDAPEAHDIVLGSLQSLAMKDYAPDLFDTFGLVVFDECHHLSAEVFSRALPKLTGATVLMGLSATLDRKDGLRNVFEWFLGQDGTVRAPVVDDGAVGMRVQVHAYGCEGASGGSYGTQRTMWNGQPNFSAMMSDVVNHAPRTRHIVSLLLDAMTLEPGRKALVLSDRRAHLAAIEAEILGRGLGHTVGYFMGGMKAAALKASEGCDVMLGTVSMAQEAMDCPHLDTLLFATPMSSVEQAVGRIQRQKAADRLHVPLTIDVVDGEYGVFRGQARKRRTFYKRRGFVIELME